MESAIRSAMAVMVMLAGFIGTAPAALAQRAPAEPETMRVGVAGNEPFVVETGGTLEGIAVEVWQSAAAQPAGGSSSSPTTR